VQGKPHKFKTKTTQKVLAQYKYAKLSTANYLQEKPLTSSILKGSSVVYYTLDHFVYHLISKNTTFQKLELVLSSSANVGGKGSGSTF